MRIRNLDPPFKKWIFLILVQLFFHTQKVLKHFFITIFYYLAQNDNNFFLLFYEKNLIHICFE